MAFIESLSTAVAETLLNMGRAFALIVPKIVIASVVIVFGYLLGWLLGHGVKKALFHMKFDERMKAFALAKPFEKVKWSGLLGWITKWYTFIVFAASGANYISLEPVTSIANSFAYWFPKVLVSIAILLAGAFIAEHIYKALMHVSLAHVSMLASLSKYFVLVLAVITAMDQIVDLSVLRDVTLIVVGGVSVGIALALGIAFGLALRDEAVGWVAEFKKK
jgi:hypothetical protein